MHSINYGTLDRKGLNIAIVALSAIIVTSACSRDDVPEHAVMMPIDDLPQTIVGQVSWEGVDEPKVIRRSRCEMQDEFYVMVGEGRDFELRVGFWGQEAADISEIDFDQADSVELRAIDDELYFYRYSIQRSLPGMGPVDGSVDSARGKTWLRPTSTEAVVKHRAGVEVEFEFSCSQPQQAQSSGS